MNFYFYNQCMLCATDLTPFTLIFLNNGWMNTQKQKEMMMNVVRINEIKKRLQNLLELERIVADKTLNKAKKDDDQDIIILSQSYIMALQRIQDLINNLFKTLK